MESVDQISYNYISTLDVVTRADIRKQKDFLQFVTMSNQLSSR